MSNPIFAPKGKQTMLLQGRAVGTLSLLLLAIVASASIVLVGCSDDPAAGSDTNPNDASTADGPNAVGPDGGPLPDAQPDVVGPVAQATTEDPKCLPGEPTSCCFAQKKYGGRAGADQTCGPNGDEDCCTYDDIPGGSFNRSNNASFPATLPSFKLGRYLITTARFKVWMEEGGGLTAKAPAEGAGAHPALPYPASGWKPAWNTALSKTPEDLALKVYSDPASQGWGCTLDFYPQQPRYPVSCIDYYLAQAFCAWDGGYAITEAMWEYAVQGGSEQRVYPWGSAEPTTLEQSVYCLNGGGTWNVDLYCNNPSSPVPKDVGWAKMGKGKWGTYDLVGNLMNMVIDDQGPYSATCTNDCVIRPATEAPRAVARGIAFLYPNTLLPAEYTNMMTGRPVTVRKTFNGANFGFRCAYPNAWPSK